MLEKHIYTYFAVQGFQIFTSYRKKVFWSLYDPRIPDTRICKWSLRSTFYGLMKEKLLLEAPFREINLSCKVTVDQLKSKKVCLGNFWRFLTSALTLRTQSRYVPVFQALFRFYVFGTFCRIKKLRVSSFCFTVIFK